MLPGAAFFEAVLPASAAAAAATSSASSRRQRRQQNLSTLLVLQSHGVLLPGAAFFEAVFTGISSSSRRQQNLSTNAVFLDFSRFPDDTLGSFFRVVLDLARPSEPWCFAAGSCFFSKLFYRHQQQQPPPPVLRAAAGNRIFRPCSSFRAMVFCCRGLLFSKLFYRHQQQQTVATSPASSRRQQNLLTISRQCAVFLGFQTTR